MYKVKSFFGYGPMEADEASTEYFKKLQNLSKIEIISSSTTVFNGFFILTVIYKEK